MKNGGRGSLEKSTQEEFEAKSGIPGYEESTGYVRRRGVIRKFRFRRHDILTIVDELRDDLEYHSHPDTRQAPCGYSASYSGFSDVCEFVSGTWRLRSSASTSQPHPQPSIE